LLGNEIEKTFEMKEMAIVLILKEDSMWREGLLIKLNRMGIRGRFYNWIYNLDFLSEPRFRVKEG